VTPKSATKLKTTRHLQNFMPNVGESNKDLERILNIQLQSNKNDVSHNQSSYLSDLTNNTSLVFNTMKLEKVQGSCFNNKNHSPFTHTKKHFLSDSDDDHYEDRNF
jgi:hypothetical protein